MRLIVIVVIAFLSFGTLYADVAGKNQVRLLGVFAKDLDQSSQMQMGGGVGFQRMHVGLDFLYLNAWIPESETRAHLIGADISFALPFWSVGLGSRESDSLLSLSLKVGIPARFFPQSAVRGFMAGLLAGLPLTWQPSEESRLIVFHQILLLLNQILGL